MTDTVWRGVAIAEGLTDNSVITQSRTVRTKQEVLEGEEGSGLWHFHFLEVPDSDILRIVSEAARTLKPSWYLHLVKDDQMVVVFEGTSFTVAKADTQGIAEVKAYAIANGVHPEQIEL